MFSYFLGNEEILPMVFVLIRCMSTSPCFSTIFKRGHNFSNFLFKKSPSKMEDNLKGKKYTPKEANSFP